MYLGHLLGQICRWMEKNAVKNNVDPEFLLKMITYKNKFNYESIEIYFIQDQHLIYI